MNEVVEAIERFRLILILRHVSLVQLESLAGIFQGAGLRLVEVTLNSELALESIKLLQRSGFLVGAGTAVDPVKSEAALKAGARFLVSPTWESFLPELCTSYQAVSIPGAFTPSEILAAYRGGADFVKLFPASMLGPPYLEVVRAPLSQLRLIPVGGVNGENAADFLRAGAAALGVGSSIIKPEWVEQGRLDVIAEELRRLVKIAEGAV